MGLQDRFVFPEASDRPPILLPLGTPSQQVTSVQSLILVRMTVGYGYVGGDFRLVDKLPSTNRQMSFQLRLTQCAAPGGPGSLLSPPVLGPRPYVLFLCSY